jgi:phytoene/squalene synthetase
VVTAGIEAAYASFEQTARAHYENFPVASVLLPARMRRHVAAVYAFARAADDFADEGEQADEQRIRLLDGWQERLRRAVNDDLQLQSGAGEPDNAPAIFHALAHTIRECSLPPELLDDLLSAEAVIIGNSVRGSIEVESVQLCLKSNQPLDTDPHLCYPVRKRSNCSLSLRNPE